MLHCRAAPGFMDDAAFRRYAEINLPHARTVAERVLRTLEALDAFGQAGNGGGLGLRDAIARLEHALMRFLDDPPPEEALRAADEVAALARGLVAAIVGTHVASDRLGQHVRNLFECLGLPAEGRELSLRCGERADSLLR